MRGTVDHKFSLLKKKRFIPACAGNSIPSSVINRSVSVHPRVCGEQKIRKVTAIIVNGSSPRVRGTAKEPVKKAGTHRFIPACAGNSTGKGFKTNSATVHPRVCGEQYKFGLDFWFVSGSSPRVRGTVKISSSFINFVRFIPACAGNSECILSAFCKGAVHPRVCGEQFFAAKS